jgi:DNA-binding response OmpR family regulator
MTRHYILLADDDTLLQELILRALRKEGFEAEAVENGELALQSVRHRRPDLLLLDAQMPVMDGFTTLKTLKADPDLSHVPVLMLTARRSQADVVQATSLGAIAYVVKPFDTRTLLARIDEAIRRQGKWTSPRAGSAPPPKGGTYQVD